MKILSMAFVLIALTFGMQEARGETGLGVGIIAGEPTGISVKKWMSTTRAFDFAAAWSFSENKAFQIHVDYLLHNFSLLRSSDFKGRLPVYYGVGGRIKLRNTRTNDEDTSVGLRLPLGISYLFADAPLDLFVEVVPVLDVAPDTELDLNAAFGIRFYFR